eukprot:m.132549 g.132549  ORF g.132549 m.132549 type:complete len:316 (-) comp9489_c0_seq8:2124-3071(-)
MFTENWFPIQAGMDRGVFLNALPGLQRLPGALERALAAALTAGADTCGPLQRVQRVFSGLCCFLLPPEKTPDSVLFFACAPGQDATQMPAEIITCHDSDVNQPRVLFSFSGSTYAAVLPDSPCATVDESAAIPFGRVRFPLVVLRFYEDPTLGRGDISLLRTAVQALLDVQRVSSGTTAAFTTPALTDDTQVCVLCIDNVLGLLQARKEILDEIATHVLDLDDAICAGDARALAGSNIIPLQQQLTRLGSACARLRSLQVPSGGDRASDRVHARVLECLARARMTPAADTRAELQGLLREQATAAHVDCELLALG